MPGSSELLSRGYQGEVYKTQTDSQSLIVKQPMGSGLARWARRAMIRREHKVYLRLDGIPGVPRCFGLQDGERLVLEFMEGTPMRELGGQVPDPERFYAHFLQLILAMHRAGVAHADMKRKDNILVTADGLPCLIDFGSAVLGGEDAGVIRSFVFRQACRIDLNAWIKLKYQRQYQNISEADRQYYRPTILENLARVIRKTWRTLTGRQLRKARRRRKSS